MWIQNCYKLKTVEQCYYQELYVAKKKRFMKEQEVKAWLSSLGLKIRLNKTALLGDILFWIVKKLFEFSIE